MPVAGLPRPPSFCTTARAAGARRKELIMQSRGYVYSAVIVATLALGIAASTEVSTQSACLVNARQGPIQGQDRGTSCAFLGIPFAAPPVGALRWKPPQAAPTWTTTRNATTPPPSCPNVNTGTPAGNEDCLKLNVWVADPLPGGSAPVIVWFHTGSFLAASANFASHNGQRLAEETGVVIVAANYRLGPLGFLAHPALAAEEPSTGNYGLQDQQAALAWVRDNIAAFGGDPGNVTVAGTSAGGDSVGLHMTSPASAGLFHRAIIESGTPTIRWPSLTEATAQGQAFATALGCTDAAAAASCLRLKTLDQILTALPVGSQQVVEQPGRVFWQPVVDGVTIPSQPRELFAAGAFSHVPTIIGTVRDEASGSFVTRSFPIGPTAEQYAAWVHSEFGADGSAVLAQYPSPAFASPFDAMSRLVTDAQFVCESRRLARYLSDAHVPAYVFSYDYVIPDLSADRVFHGVESNILFGNNYVPPQFASHALTPADNAVHAAMAGYWTRFAATGDPNVDDDALVHWQLFRSPLGAGRGADRVLIIDAAIGGDKRLREQHCDFWERFFLRSILSSTVAN
jgi:para-nitrobenzyl esterase